mmetsp:Transcript_32252/g.28569  ORF Transcript_32252/g.28569 Transcript_32252/m.28569 type:complete len:131 (+) Transcript_32252:476-868(+)
MDDLFIHPFVMYDASGSKVSPVSSQRSLSNKINTKEPGHSISSKNSVPGFLRKYLTSASATSTNRVSDGEVLDPAGAANDNIDKKAGEKGKDIFYRHFSKASDYIRHDGKNKHSIVSISNANDMGHFSYY